MSMADDLVNIEIDGVPVKARKGEMLIRVTDAHGAYVPRFCYRSEEHTSELQSQSNLVCRLLLEKKKHRGISNLRGSILRTARLRKRFAFVAGLSARLSSFSC